jgi:hypothetical protein
LNTIDLDRPPPNHQFNVSIAREETAGERRVRLFKEVVLFLVAIGFVILVVWIYYSTLASSAASPEEKKWAMSVLSAATGGVIGYLVRR